MSKELKRLKMHRPKRSSIKTKPNVNILIYNYKQCRRQEERIYPGILVAAAEYVRRNVV